MAYDYATFSTLAGPVTPPADENDYRVDYRRVMVGRERWQVLPLLVVTLGLSSLFFVWLLQPQHYPNSRYLPTAVAVGNHIMFWLVVVTEGIRLLNSVILCWSSYIMRNPVPVTPPSGLRVAFTTTIVPSKEPVDVVRDTLIAARNIQYELPIDVWLLDEGDDPEVRAMCDEVGVRHFTRKGIERWNTSKGAFRAKTKHGNHNSWLDAHGANYDVVLSVDPDHIPLPNFAERMLGYFRDTNVAFVVGPQVYGNFRHYLTRGAEAQNYMFHSVIQRAANRFACGMFVGTNHAYRVATWRQIGGFQDSITEDLATSFAVHGARNPETGHRWTSVYTPDVVAVGEGPANWTDFFSQQLRWARGANEVMVTEAPRRLKALDWGPRLHYLTLMVHYPTVAITWILGTVLTVLYMALGSTGIVVHVSSWLALYFDVFIARLLLYFWLRRFNISPHEEKGSAGMSGIFVSVLCTPFYSTALVGALLRRKLGFVVTPKGGAASPDRLLTFRKHLFWAGISAGSIAAAAGFGHLYPANMIWASVSLITCLLPIGLWGIEPILAPRRAVAPNPLPAAHIPLQRVEVTEPATTATTAVPATTATTPEPATTATMPEPAPTAMPAPTAEPATTTTTGPLIPSGPADPGRPGRPGRLVRPSVRRRGWSPSPRRPLVGPAAGATWRPDDLTLSGLEFVGAHSGGDAQPGDPGEPPTQDDSTVIVPRPGVAGVAGAVDGDSVVMSRPATGGDPREPKREPRREPLRTERVPVTASRSDRARQEADLLARREALVERHAAAGQQPRYVEDVTLRLHPRRRRVSLDGLLEELS